LVTQKQDQKVFTPGDKDTASTDDSDNNSWMGAPAAAGVATGTAGRCRTKTSILQYRVFAKKKNKKEPLIIVRRNESDDSDSSTSDYSAPRAPSPKQQRPPGNPPRAQYSSEPSDDDDADDDDANDSEEDSVGSVYTTPGPQQEKSLCFSVSTDTDESAPMDERAERRRARMNGLVAPTPPPMPMDEQAIDAMIQRSLRAASNTVPATKRSIMPKDERAIDAMIQRSLTEANHIIKNHRSRHRAPSVSSRPYVTGLTDLDDI
jgi:hypothetical protein